ncbi:MOSC N-terminal beta barrel domain-containing protein [Neptuniibacter sp. QD34_54]|uniref:MOSC N-terminal beta barrel domain-containing protein n=1 Tax=Neptuniibacter sp. QD34_54 TaxID=3398208 RepID=UPI0039F45902
MSDIQLSGINTFPIKSLGGISLSDAFVTESGLSFDRRFMLSDPEGELLSARQVPSMLLFETVLREDGLEVIAPDGDHLSLRYPDFFQNYRQVRVWGTEINAQHCGEWLDEWFSEKLGRECQLLYFGEQSERVTSRRPDKPVAFADGYPLLVISEASLADLNSRASTQVNMDHFRTNLVVKGCEAFAEDSWKRIRIGEVEFEIVKDCSRCVLTTIDPKTGQPVPAGEPIKTLANYRKGEDNEVYFGQNLVPLNEGQIKQGDTVEVLEVKQPAQYPDNAPVIRDTNDSNSQETWAATQQVDLECIRRIDETRDVVTFRFAVPQGLSTDYIAGQFLTLMLPINGETVTRCYTVSSSPSRSADIAITVKRVTDGIASNWLHDNLQVGDKLPALAPQGEFHEGNTGNKPLLLLSAGSGITPMLSIARELTDRNSQRDVVFYHQARTEADLICEDELLWLERQNPNLKIIFSLSQPDDDWQGIKGRISRKQLIELIPDLPERTVMCCGPEGFMDHAKTYCRQLGLAEQQWFEESFGAPPGVDPEAEKHSVLLTFGEISFAGDSQTTLLEQAEDQGIMIPSGCRAGVCGACKVTLVSGHAHRQSEIPLSEDEKARGVVLACSCTPETDVVIEV